jgi:cytochrome P450
MFPATTTVTTTLNFAMAFLLHNPRVQTKVQQELDAVVGRDRLPTLDDRARSVQISVPIMNIARNTAVATLKIYRTFCNMVCEILEMK